MRTAEGNISALRVREKRVFDKRFHLLQPGQAPNLLESEHEIFIGYESGAIGLMKVWLEANGAKGDSCGQVI